jgi:hypothetical protein
MMKTVSIKPVKAFTNTGKLTIATQLSVESAFDNLFDHVVFKYLLLDAGNQRCGESTFSLVGREAYCTWFATPEGAFEIVAAGIGVEIVPSDTEGKVAFLEI